MPSGIVRIRILHADLDPGRLQLCESGSETPIVTDRYRYIFKRVAGAGLFPGGAGGKTTPKFEILAKRFLKKIRKQCWCRSVSCYFFWLG